MIIRLAIFAVFSLFFGSVSGNLALAGGDAGKGQDLFHTCAACHQIGNGARNDVGPVLNNIIGRRAASRDGFVYSRAMKEKGADGLVWTEQTLDAYLANPRNYVRGTRMAYAGLHDDVAREDLIAFLKTLKFDGPAETKILK
ncbi:c-type cytochrome [Microbaculum marinisediminis]|uniref:Cytochrome c family protein n=1 Tax=Microbaculum marinisediminis TaxID=2931392 RepID=A0AAW5QQR7_9HYPH|nr:cytochrome c family protein [Microbaculum sp. A6E488]MCT8970431.1 cytochrome c family protein [Microbaculum sp. A6E488]